LTYFDIDSYMCCRWLSSYEEETVMRLSTDLTPHIVVHDPRQDFVSNVICHGRFAVQE